MKYAILSAGEGSRLTAEGISVPKPLVPISGVAMIDRLIDIFISNLAEEIIVVINALHPSTYEHLQELQRQLSIPLRVIVQTTPSSMHSFYAISDYLRGCRFCLTTVDTIFRANEFAAFIHAFESSQADGMMAVTDFIDDESPLYITVDERNNITGFYDRAMADSRYISGGIYCLGPSSIDTLHRCIASGMSRMRNYQRALLADGAQLIAYPFTKIIDVDHSSDIATAEAFINEH